MKMPFTVAALGGCHWQENRVAKVIRVSGSGAACEVAKRLDCVRLAGALRGQSVGPADRKAAPRRAQSKRWRDTKAPGLDQALNSCRAADCRHRRGERGSAVILVLILAMIMAALIADNGLVLHRLKQEIKLIEKKQAKKYQQPPHHAPARGARTALSAQTPVSELADMAVRAPAGRPVAQEADAHTSVSVAPQPKPDKAP